MSYVIAGRAIKSEYLAIGTLVSTIGLAVAMSGGSKKKDTAAHTPATQTFGGGSKEEDDFIRNFIAEADKADKAGGH
ncbi:hypothetical protein M422DRAFT_782573 [Sphaerobolus stellatus SS14]|uniref:ATP synthase subunit K, mitochondrial n=1 Tax=Sphaerobolus stellatus (strain SS14) TaxID=990650 RepID=A0A0C9UK87_SPHS4|nr:hypothetical protein M422DRAFT_782573 [Sphaerobolus stellatus SS14]